MLTEVMRFYGLVRAPVDAGFFETEHRAQVERDIRAAIMGGRLIALTTVIGSGETVLSRRRRADLAREGRVVVSRSLSIDKAKISVPLLVARPAGAVPARQGVRGAVRRRRARPPPEDADRVEAPHRTGCRGWQAIVHRTVSTTPAVMGLAPISNRPQTRAPDAGQSARISLQPHRPATPFAYYAQLEAVPMPA